jgi:tetratricopeptide (TPR) repeat protein
MMSPRALPLIAVFACAVAMTTMAAAAGGPERLLNEGDRAALAGDGATAIAKYRSILAEDPRNALVHYRVAQVQAMNGELNEAEQAYFAALRFSGTDQALRAKVLFCIADLRERQRAYEAAVDAWTEYEKQSVKAPSATPHAGTAAERKNRVAEWKRALSAAAETKARVEHRTKELGELDRKKSK